MAHISLATLAATLRAFANTESAKAAFRGRQSLQDLAVVHVNEAARILEVLGRKEPAMRAKLGPRLPWEDSI